MKELAGRTIERVERDEKSHHLAFYTSKGERLLYVCVDDCTCDETWVHHFSGVSAVLGGTISAIEEIPEYESYPATRQEDDHGEHRVRDRVFGYRLITNKGTAVVELRNSSNGYYNGSMELETLHEATPVAVTDDF